MIIGCDGVYDVFSNEEIDAIVITILTAYHTDNSDLRREFLSRCGLGPGEINCGNSATIIATAVARLALVEGSTDNVSCAALIFKARPWPLRP